jgi:cyclase
VIHFMQITSSISAYFSLVKLSEGVYAAIAIPGKGAMSNSGFVDLGHEVIVFDTFTTPNAARDLRRVAEEITEKEIKYVFNSHYHGDHTFGNQVFEDSIIISTSITRDLHKEKNKIHDINKEKEEMSKYLNQLEIRVKTENDSILRASIVNQINEMEKVKEAIPELRTVLPNLTFEYKLVIHGEDRTVEFCCYGGGHTPSDAFLYLPKEKIAFMGDIVLENLHPPVFNSQMFITNLTKVSKMDIERIVTGHGGIVTKNQIYVMLQYLNHLNATVTSSMENGEKLESTATPEEYSTWMGIDGYKRNLNVIYNEHTTAVQEDNLSNDLYD